MREFIFREEETTIPVKGKRLVICAELVRCKDCVHCNEVDVDYGYSECKWYGTNDPDWFCADGKRKEDGQ